MADWSQ